MARHLKEFVFDTASLLQRSPISNHFSHMPLPVTALVGELSELKNDMDVISRKLVNPLKVAIMGEVKAGKSTLINLLIGAEVSPVDIKEATSSIIVIHHNDVPVGKIIWQEGLDVEGTADEIYAILKDKKGNLDFFSEIKEVIFGLPLPNLSKLHLVDTPGLATITEQNEETTTNYMQEADVVLWVLNANHLGQSDVDQALAEVAKLGKTVIGILNRIDEVDGDSDRLVAFAEQELGIYLQLIFPMSVHQAYEGLQEKNHSKLLVSGYLELLEYLEKRIETKADRVHYDSIVQSLLALLRKNLAFHESYSRSLQFLSDQLKEHQSDLDYHNLKIKQNLEETLQHWADFEFMRNEKQEIHEKIQSMRMLSGKQEKKDIEYSLEHYFSSENINRQIQSKLKELHTSMQVQWDRAMVLVEERRAKQFQEFVTHEEQQLQISLYEVLPSGQELVLEGAGKGAAIAGAWGATAAAYAAWLGPYASTVSIGAAAGAILPPLLIAGAVTGAVAKLVSFKRQKQRYQVGLDQAFKEAKNEITSNLMPKLIASIRGTNDDFVANLQGKFAEMIASGNSELDIQRLALDISQYIEENKALINLRTIDKTHVL